MKTSHEPGGTEYLHCLCRNTNRDKGFYPFEVKGKIGEPTPAELVTNLVVCDECGRMIDSLTLEVVGRRQP